MHLLCALFIIIFIFILSLGGCCLLVLLFVPVCKKIVFILYIYIIFDLFVILFSKYAFLFLYFCCFSYSVLMTNSSVVVPVVVKIIFFFFFLN